MTLKAEQNRTCDSSGSVAHIFLLCGGLTVAVLFLPSSHCDPGAAAALRRPVQHLRLCVPAERQLSHQRAQEPGVPQQLKAADGDPAERKKEASRNRRGVQERLAPPGQCGSGTGFD